MSKASERLASYIDALFPIIYIEHFDFKVIDEMIVSVADGINVVEYNNFTGAIDFRTRAPQKEMNLVQFLDIVKDEGYERSTYIVLKDVHKQLDDPNVISLLKYIAERNIYNDSYYATVFIVASKMNIPAELSDYITIFDIPLPDENRIVEIINEFKRDIDLVISDDVADKLAISFKGLNEFQIKQILNLAYQDGGNITLLDEQLVLSQKEQFIKKAGLLEMVPVKESIEEIGGLDSLKNWLVRKSLVFKKLDKAIKYGVDIPKGTLIVGMPGCGKSLSAKATAKLFNMPLFRLDVGRLLGKYVGESEENMRKALRLAEAVSPCVLWIDEIEKAFAGVGSSGGESDVTMRLFGNFLTWMQEKENTVFIVATANSIVNIPTEFLRKGRFDELFFVDMPNMQERMSILKIHLEKRGKLSNDIILSKIVADTDGYNGADLEAIVKEAVESAFIEGRDVVTTEDLEKAQKNTKSISVTLKDKINEIRETSKKIDLKPASADVNVWLYP